MMIDKKCCYTCKIYEAPRKISLVICPLDNGSSWNPDKDWCSKWKAEEPIEDIDTLSIIIDTLKTALEFYADPGNWKYLDIVYDQGNIAKKALDIPKMDKKDQKSI